MRKGDYKTNLESVKKYSEGIIRSRQTKASNSTDCVPCPHCFGFMRPKSIYEHVKSCSAYVDEKKLKTPLLASSLLLSSHCSNGNFHDAQDKILSKMNRNDFHLIIRNDGNLVALRSCGHAANVLFGQTSLIEFRKVTINENKRASDLVSTKNDAVVDAAKNITGYNGPRDIKVPNTFCKIGFCFRNLVLIIRATSLKEENGGILG